MSAIDRETVTNCILEYLLSMEIVAENSVDLDSDLALDSLTRVELIVEIEEVIGRELEDSILIDSTLRSVRDFVDACCGALEAVEK